MYWKLVFVSGFTHLFGVKFLVYKYASVNFVTFRKAAHPVFLEACEDLFVNLILAGILFLNTFGFWSSSFPFLGKGPSPSIKLTLIFVRLWSPPPLLSLFLENI